MIKHNRLDMNYVAEIAAALNQEPESKQNSSFIQITAFTSRMVLPVLEYTLKNKKRLLPGFYSVNLILNVFWTLQNGASIPTS
ncbi:hypothetical protein CS542_09870 [Pedobacter sp. IW39]|nr:hypothetical protein CS542_09870 [Pedobacter sp. IW39]